MTADNAVAALVDQPIAEGLGDRTAFVTAERSFTYAELRALVDRAGRALRARGVEPEQRVALLMRDGIALVAAFLGALKIGAVAVPINTRLSPRELRVLVDDCRPKRLVADADLGAAAAGELASAPVGGIDAMDDLLRGVASDPLEPERVGLDAMAFWLYTSGTTGSPKAAMHAHRTLAAGGPYAEVLGMSARDRVFSTSKLFFAYALGTALVIPLSVRASAYLTPDWADPASIRSVVERYRPTVLFSVPTVYAATLRADLPRDTFASVRACVSAGEVLPADVYEAWRDRFGVEILDAIGATETIFMMLSNRPGASRAGTTGTPVPGVEVELRDAAGAVVADGEPGVLWARIPSAAVGYYKRIDHSRRTFVGEWFRTGDVFRRERDGSYVHCGREDDGFKVAGQWVMPSTLEAVVRRHPNVADAGAVGAEDAGGLVKPFVFVVPRDGRSAAADIEAGVRRLIESSLPKHQWPRGILLVDELPRTATGKLQRFRLRERVKRTREETSR